ASDQSAAALPKIMINSRRLMASPAPRTTPGNKNSITFWVEKCPVRYTDGPSSCPLWVISGHGRRTSEYPLYPQLPTSPKANLMSAKRQQQTNALQQKS